MPFVSFNPRRHAQRSTVYRSPGGLIGVVRWCQPRAANFVAAEQEEILPRYDDPM
jgi:hypothetical protein